MTWAPSGSHACVTGQSRSGRRECSENEDPLGGEKWARRRGHGKARQEEGWGCLGTEALAVGEEEGAERAKGHEE